MEEVVHIPVEIIRPILLKLKVKALIRCQSVCKEWRSIVQDDPDFDPESDEFKELPIPRGESCVILGMGIMDDCLCVAREWKEGEMIEVLVMKEYGVKKSWVTEFLISAAKFKREFTCDYRNITLYSSKCNTKLLICSSSVNSWEILVYDLNYNTLNRFLRESSVPYGGLNGICSYVQSIISPHEFIWRDDHCEPSENNAVLRFILELFNI